MSRGFSLAELIVVIAISAVVLGAVMPFAVNSSDSQGFDNQCLNIKDTIDYARQLAISSGRAYRFVISEEQRYYYIEQADLAGEFEALDGMFGRRIEIADCVLQIELDGFVNLGSYSYLEFRLSDFDVDAKIGLYGKGKLVMISITDRDSKVVYE